MIIVDRLLEKRAAEGCILKCAVEKDAVLTYEDVEIPGDRLVDRLRREQSARFASPHPESCGEELLGEVVT